MNIMPCSFPLEDPEALAGALDRLLGDPSLGQALAQRGLVAARKASFPHRAALIADFVKSL